nr:hypothetical protein [Candidatus Obscuribacter sp.]
RGQIFIDLDKPSGGMASEDPDELQAPLFIAPAKIKKGAVKALRLAVVSAVARAHHALAAAKAVRALVAARPVVVSAAAADGVDKRPG